MTAYMSKGAGVLIVVRVAHRVGLRTLTLALYHSNEQLGNVLSRKAVRAVVASVLLLDGDVDVTVSDYLSEAREFEAGDSTVDERLEWARHLVLNAYRADFRKFPEELAAFKALALSDIA